MKKRILAALLACVMVISLLPATALAAPGDDDAYTVKVGEELEIQGADGGWYSTHRWQSGNPDVASVDPNKWDESEATVTGKSEGETTITHEWGHYEHIIYGEWVQEGIETFTVQVIGNGGEEPDPGEDPDEPDVPGGEATLTPGNNYFEFGGDKTDAENADITLHKQAELNSDGTYKVTLSATAKETIQVVPTEVVFVIDGSGSMSTCAQPNHDHGRWGNDCDVTDWGSKGERDFNHPESRWQIAKSAIQEMTADLDPSIEVTYVVFGPRNRTVKVDDLDDQRVNQFLSTTNQTYLSNGVEAGINAFENDDSNKVLIIVADGDSNDEYPKQKLRSFDGEVYTVGFVFSNDDFSDLADDEDHQLNASDPGELDIVMQTIGSRIKSLITDPLGKGVQLMGDVDTTLSDGEAAPAVVRGDVITWTDPAGLSGTVTLTYDVALKGSAKEAGTYTVPLNDRATLNYSYNDGESKTIPFPEPEATVCAATLDVIVDGENESHQWLNLDTDEDFDLSEIPGVGEEYIEGKWVASVTVTAKDGDQDVDGVTLDDLSSPDPYAYTVTVTLTDEEPEEPSGLEVAYYINLPTASTELTTSPKDYRFLTIGGSVVDTVEEDPGQYDNHTGTPVYGQDAILELVESYPEDGIKTESEFHYQTSSVKIGEDSSLTFNNDGTVTSFELYIDDGTGANVRCYSSDAEKSWDKCAYGIQWGKLSYATTYRPYGSIGDEGWISAIHVDGVLYKITTADEVVTVEDVAKALKKTVTAFPENVEAETFAFELEREESSSSAFDDEFEPIDLTATVTTEEKDVHLAFDAEDSEGEELAETVLTPGTYTVTERLTADQENVWQTPNVIKFSVYSNGEIVFENNTTTITNTPKFVADPGLTVEKELTSVTRSEETLTDLDGFVAQVGDTLHYTITVTNTGNTEQSGTITDKFTVEGNTDAALIVGTITKPDGCTVTETDGGWTFGELPATETITISASYKVKPGDKSIRNSVDVDSNVPNTPDDPNKDDDTVDTDVASLTVEKKADRETAFVGDTITYTITVTNTGDVELTDVEVTDDMMPDTVTVKTGDSEATTGTAENGAYTIGTLEADSVVIITYTYTVKAEDVEDGKVSNTVTVKSDDLDDPVIDTTETEILPSATKVTKHVVTNGTTVPGTILGVIEEKDLTVTYPAPAPVDEQGNLGNPQIAASAGETITLLYEISVFGNEGAHFLVTEDYGTTYIGVVGAELDPMQTLSEPPQYSGTLNGTSATLYFTKTFTVEEDGEGGFQPLTNSVTAYVDGEDEEVTEEVDVLKPGLNVEKTVQINGKPYKEGMVANENDKLTYTITVKNTGETELKDIVITDTMWVSDEGQPEYYPIEIDGGENYVPADGSFTLKEPIAPSKSVKITYTYTVTAEDVIAGSVSNTVTAESGNGDESTDEVKVPAGSITITPANITIYTGGKGYKSVIGNEGATGVPSTGLPEPGYYIELPTALDAALKEALEVDERTTLDLSDYLTFLYDDGNGTTRTWKLERYDDKEGNTSQTSEGRYIYRILPDGTSGIAVRLQFTDGGEITTDDIFALSESNLYQTYSMTIYAGDLNQDLVQAVLDWPDDKDAPHHDVTVGSGELTVRGITDADGEATTTEIAETAPESEVNNVTAVIDADTKLYINESSLEVADTDSVELLVDSVVSTAVQDLKDSAVDQVSAITDDHEAQFYYLDLVDTDNGNTVVTTKNEPVTLFFPYPEGTDADTAFHIVHYVNQDRDESAKDEIADVNEGSEKFAIEVYSEENQNLETTDQGIQITVTSFSPFGLFWEEDSGSSGGHTGGGGSSRPSRPTLNTEDHYSYIIGYSDGTLQPYGTITRGEVATIFFRLLTDDSREEWWSQVNDYSDCNSDLWCNNAISTLSNMGIIDGFSDGTFRPYAKITRAQFAKIAVGFFETTREDYQGYFTDVDIDAWYTEYVEAAARVGLIEGFNDGTFRPNTNITRAQACVIVNRALGRAPDEDRLLDEDEMITWPDNNPDDWFYADMQEATNSHDYTWTTVSGDKVENWTDKLPQRDWAALEHAWSTAHSAPGGEVTE